MKTQILRGLLRDRCGDDAQKEAGAAGRVEGASRSDERSHEDLVKTGAVTPLDAFDDPTIGLTGRRRKTLQDYKVAEGMTVKLPRSRRPKARTRESVRKQAESGNDCCGELDNAETSIDSSTSVQPQRSSRGDEGVSAEENAAVQCPVCAQMVTVDDPANPDICLSRHMDRCTRSARRTSCRQAGEARGLERGSDASTRPRAASRGGPCLRMLAIVLSLSDHRATLA